MYQIAIVGKPSPLRFRIRQHLQSNATFHLLTYSHPAQMLEAIDEYGLSTIVLSLDVLGRPQLRQLRFIDEYFRSVPLLLVAPRISDDIRTELTRATYANIRILDSRFEMQDLSAVVQKMGNGQPVHHRAHCRYKTHQTGSVVGNMGSESRVRLVNISFGGALLELRDTAAIYDDEVLIQVNTSHRRKQSLGVRARVMWQDPNSRRIGVQFCESAQQRPVMLMA